MSASSPREAMRTLTWPGVWPSVGIEIDLLAHPVIDADQIDEPRVEHGLDRVRVRAPVVVVLLPAPPVLELRASDQVAGAGKGRRPSAADERRVPAHVVDVQVGAEHDVDRLGGHPAAARSSRNGPCNRLQAGMLRSLSLPMHVSTMIRRVGVSMTSACTLMRRRPRSSMKCGWSQRWGWTASGVASGRMNRDPPVASISTIRVMRTSPIRQLAMRHDHAPPGAGPIRRSTPARRSGRAARAAPDTAAGSEAARRRGRLPAPGATAGPACSRSRPGPTRASRRC